MVRIDQGEGLMNGNTSKRVEIGMEPTVMALAPDRYVPCIIKDALLPAWYDYKDDNYVVVCPECHRLITYKSERALCLAMV
jgi:hypothetical protein